MSLHAAPQRIGETLLHMGLISTDQLHIALHEQDRSGEPIGRQLVRLGFLSEATLREALARTLDRPSVDLSALLPDVDALALVPQHVARRFNLIPLSYDAGRRHLVIASSEINDIVTQDQVRRVLFCIAGQNLYFSETLALRGAP